MFFIKPSFYYLSDKDAASRGMAMPFKCMNYA